ncbi:hypothetical protein TNCV_665911 [Trichonephila clavipes]|uniref:Uncharacterized protein n=1 Tax=Trichonephila clavipes TaxID=2585209 RepID=A0A8X6VM19_TRICX|nr:hypothetical protein TNCV_665911 [Trichonephila clavipes]
MASNSKRKPNVLNIETKLEILNRLAKREYGVSLAQQKTGFQMLNDDEIATSVQEESDHVDDETDEDEDNNNSEISKGPSNADAFFCVGDSYRVVGTTIRMLSYSTTVAQENQRPCSKKKKKKRRCTMVQRKVSDYSPQ